MRQDRAAASVRAGAQFLVYLLLVFGAREGLRASGQLVDLNAPQGRGHLVHGVIERHAINYCVRIADEFKPAFSYDSIDEQTRTGLSLWLAAAEDVVKSPVNVTRLACDNPRTDLIVAIEASSRFPDLESFQQLICSEKRCLSRIILNAAYRDPKRADSPALLDFGRLVQQGDSAQPLSQFTSAGNQRHMSVYDFALWTNIVGYKIAASTYPLLIHELGHAFGLCDTYAIDDTFQKRCDPLFSTSVTSREQPNSIMKDGGGYLFLTPDDVDGVRRLFLRYSSKGAAR